MPAGSRIEGQNTRRSQRLTLRVPVRVECNRGLLAADTHTIVISAHGALVRLPWELPLGHELTVENVSTGDRQVGIVAFVEGPEDEQFDVGVAFSQPDPKFWGVSFPPDDWTPGHPDAKANL